jgi:hypothetical protein
MLSWRKRNGRTSGKKRKNGKKKNGKLTCLISFLHSYVFMFNFNGLRL